MSVDYLFPEMHKLHIASHIEFTSRFYGHSYAYAEMFISVQYQ